MKSDLNIFYLSVMFLKLLVEIVEVFSKVLVFISQVAALNSSHPIYPNLGYPVKSAENRLFCTKSDVNVLKALVMFLKLFLVIAAVFRNVLA